MKVSEKSNERHCKGSESSMEVIETGLRTVHTTARGRRRPCGRPSAPGLGETPRGREKRPCSRSWKQKERQCAMSKRCLRTGRELQRCRGPGQRRQLQRRERKALSQRRERWKREQKAVPFTCIWSRMWSCVLVRRSITCPPRNTRSQPSITAARWRPDHGLSGGGVVVGRITARSRARSRASPCGRIALNGSCTTDLPPSRVDQHVVLQWLRNAVEPLGPRTHRHSVGSAKTCRQ